MERIDIDVIAEAILNAPGWARVGITALKPTLRQDAAIELARDIRSAIAPAPPAEGQRELLL